MLVIVLLRRQSEGERQQGDEYEEEVFFHVGDVIDVIDVADVAEVIDVADVDDVYPQKT